MNRLKNRSKHDLRKDLVIGYGVLSFWVSIWFISISWGPYCILYSWGAVVILFLHRIASFCISSNVGVHSEWGSTIGSLFWVLVIVTVAAGYPLILFRMATSLAKSRSLKRFLLVCSIHFAGVLLAYFIRVRPVTETAYQFRYLGYLLAIALVISYFVLDWHFTPRIIEHTDEGCAYLLSNNGAKSRPSQD